MSVRTIERRKSQPAFAEAMERGKARDGCRFAAVCGGCGQGQSGSEHFPGQESLGYKDYFSNEHSGPDGGPIVIGPAPELGELTDEELKQLSNPG